MRTRIIETCEEKVQEESLKSKQRTEFLFFCCLSAMLKWPFTHSFKGRKRTKERGGNKMKKEKNLLIEIILGICGCYS